MARAARAKLRSLMLKELRTSIGGLLEQQLRFGWLYAVSFWFGVLLAVFLMVWVGVSLAGRRAADEATGMSRSTARGIAMGCLAPIGVVSVLMRTHGELFAEAAGQALAFGAMGFSLFAPILVPLIIVRSTRQEGARVRSVWRGNLRRVLPTAIVVCAAVSLVTRLAGMRVEQAWVRDWYSQTEMERTIERIGAEWAEPTIPDDAWRAEPVPEADVG